jgi:chorismate mutase
VKGSTVAVRAVRGAIQVDEDTAESVQTGTMRLVKEVMERNGLSSDDLISVLFTNTPDLLSEFPAHGARMAGLVEVPLMCAVEISVPGALPRVVRLMAHVETSRARSELSHVYLDGATALRPDLPH